MPVFLCRWPNGDCSIMLARTRIDAVEKLDEVANAEGGPIIQLSETQVHFALGDDGQLVLEGLGARGGPPVLLVPRASRGRTQDSSQDTRPSRRNYPSRAAVRPV